MKHPITIAHTGDLHITEGPGLADQAAVLAEMLDGFAAQAPRVIIVAGDFYGHEVPHHPSPAERAVFHAWVRQCAALAPVVLVEGNHDHGPDLDTLAMVQPGEHKVYVVKTAQKLAIDTDKGPVRVYCLPYPSRRWLFAGEPIPRDAAEARQRTRDRMAAIFAGWQAEMEADDAAGLDAAHIFAGHIQVAGAMISGGEVHADNEVDIDRSLLAKFRCHYGALGHLHLRQQVAMPAYWYAGSPWRNDHAETEPVKGWHLVTIGAPDTDGRREAIVTHVPTNCRAWRTLTYRWAADYEDGVPRWQERPTDAEIAACEGAIVRLRLTVPAQWAASAPLTAETDRLACAHHVRVERIVEPVIRRRAPEVADAPTVETKIAAYWRSTGTIPLPEEQFAAFAALEQLNTLTDEQIRGAL